jgi:hypothetical protein
VAPVLTGQPTPEDDIDRLARETMATGHDLHMHAWRAQDFREMLDYAAPRFGFDVAAHVPVANENIFVLRKRAGLFWRLMNRRVDDEALSRRP